MLVNKKPLSLIKKGCAGCSLNVAFLFGIVITRCMSTGEFWSFLRS